MIKIITLTGLFICTLVFTASSQIDIYLKEYKTYITPTKCKDSIVQYIKDSSFVKINLLNCEGKMNIKEFDRNGTLLVIGQYRTSLDTLKEYVDVFNIFGDITAIKVNKYFQPLRDGIWTFYENGIIKRKERYRQGLLIRE